MPASDDDAEGPDKRQGTCPAGRFGAPGRGLIQTHFPEHPVMSPLVAADREAFYEAEIAMREDAARLALFLSRRQLGGAKAS